MRRQVLALLLTVATAGAVGCDDSNAVNTTPGGTTPSGFTVTETFTGTLTTNGAQSFSFSTAAAGTVYVTLTALTDPLAGTLPTVGVSLGTWNGTSCSVQTGIFTDTASANAAIAGTVTGTGFLCARVYDPATRVTNPLNFTITVVHP
jgi:hypothetical protein